MSLTSSYFKQHPITKKKLSRKKINRSTKKCGNCLFAELVKTKPLNGLLNEYWCSEKKINVLNCDGSCEKFINRWKHFLKPDHIIQHKDSVK